MKEEKPKSHRPLTDGEKAAIVTMRAQGLELKAIAEQLNRRVEPIKRFLKVQKEKAVAAGVDMDWKETMTTKAVTAVHAGLDCEEDAYKRGNLGSRVLVGLGHFQEGAQVNVNTLINAVPQDWRERFFVSTEEKA